MIVGFRWKVAAIPDDSCLFIHTRGNHLSSVTVACAGEVIAGTEEHTEYIPAAQQISPLSYQKQCNHEVKGTATIHTKRSHLQIEQVGEISESCVKIGGQRAPLEDSPDTDIIDS